MPRYINVDFTYLHFAVLMFLVKWNNPVLWLFTALCRRIIDIDYNNVNTKPFVNNGNSLMYQNKACHMLDTVHIRGRVTVGH